FIGLLAFQEKAPFDASLMTHFRKRLDAPINNQMNEWVVEAQMQKMEDAQAEQDDDYDDNLQVETETDADPHTEQEDELEPVNVGKLLIDATCASADIAFPTDLWLLNDAREKLEDI